MLTLKVTKKTLTLRSGWEDVVVRVVNGYLYFQYRLSLSWKPADNAKMVNLTGTKANSKTKSTY